jgi:hypothetical protein
MTLTCRCGASYTATPDGRHRHRILSGHTPVADGRGAG